MLMSCYLLQISIGTYLRLLKLMPVQHPFAIQITQATVFACCDFIVQLILVCTIGDAHDYSMYLLKYSKIYRCWIVWGHNIHVVIVPSILACAMLGLSAYLYFSLANFDLLPLAMWVVAGGVRLYAVQGEFFNPTLNGTLGVTGLATSMTVNVLVMGLIIFKILRVFREVKTNSNEQMLGVISGSTLRTVMFILIESGTALFSIQLVRLVVYTVLTTNFKSGNAYNAYNLTVGIHEMINVIIR